MAKIKPLTADQIERLTAAQVEHIQAPPRTVGSVLVGLLVAGVGGLAVAGLLFGILSALGAPGFILLAWSGRGGLLAACLYLAVWALPADKFRSLRWGREMQQQVKLHEFHKLEAYREIVTLRARIVSLEQSLSVVQNERDNARTDIYRIEQEARASADPNFVAMEVITPQQVSDASQMIRYWFSSSPEPDSRRSLSRDAAAESPYRWAQTRHRDAQGLLVRAGVMQINVRQPQIVVESQEAALRKLSDYAEHWRAATAAARAVAAQTAQRRYAEQVEI